MNMYLITWYPFHFFFKYWCLYLLSSQARYSAHLILAEFSFKFAENCFVVSYNIHLCNFRYSTMSDEKYIFFSNYHYIVLFLLMVPVDFKFLDLLASPITLNH